MLATHELCTIAMLPGRFQRRRQSSWWLLYFITPDDVRLCSATRRLHCTPDSSRHRAILHSRPANIFFAHSTAV